MKNKEKITRVKPLLGKGLYSEQVNERKKLGLVNKTNVIVGKTYFEIIFSDVFSFFNVLLFCIAGLMIAAQYWLGLSFLVVLIPNIAISLFEDIKARRLMSKLRVLTQPKAVVIRDGEESVIELKDVVLDDLIHLKTENQISVDGTLLSGSLIVNESALTGESKNIIKNVGDYLYSGSYVVSGDGYMHAEKIGEESYIETIQSKAKKFRRSPSEILKTLTFMFKVIGSIVITLAVATFLIYFFRGGFATYDLFKENMKGISGSMVAMIPSGLFLLTSVALAVAVLKLSKKGARVQDFYSVEMLARINVLCVDKTGTITNGEMDVRQVIPYGTSSYSQNDIKQIVSNLLHATKDNNLTARSLKKYFDFELTKGIEDALPFNSDNKYSAASFKGKETYVLGAPEFLNIKNVGALTKRSEEFTSQGLRVLVLGKASSIKDHKVTGEVSPIALIVLQDHIREEAIETFKWFKENKVQIKVISGDDPKTVSHIAMEAGIEGAERFISLAGMSDEDVAKVAPLYDIFGRVTPEQKEIIVQSLKSEGKTVAMTGDGVNDILALKRADCSIAMNSGSEAAKNVSHIVLINSDFNSLPDIVAEGRRVVNNLQRTASLFLVKTIFAMTTTLAFLITMVTPLKISYPFEATHFELWSLINIGLSAFFLALERNNEPISGSFAKSIFRKAIPGACVVLLPVALIYGLYALQANTLLYTGIYTLQSATTMSVITFTILGLVVLLKICLPLNKYRGIVFAGAATLEIGLLVAAAIASYKIGVKESILAINFPILTLVNWFAIAIIIVISIAIYLIVSYIVEVLRGERDNVKDQPRSRKSSKRK